MIILLTIIHVIVCLFLIVVVLLQSGKAADLAGAFGGMGSQATFGPRGTATLLSKLTTIAAGLFMVTSLTLAILGTREQGSGASVTDRLKKTDTPKQTAPASKSIKVKGSDGTETEIPLPTDLKQLPATPPSQPPAGTPATPPSK
jgi:preprotein translocase subunit SecG